MPDPPESSVQYWNEYPLFVNPLDVSTVAESAFVVSADIVPLVAVFESKVMVMSFAVHFA